MAATGLRQVVPARRTRTERFMQKLKSLHVPAPAPLRALSKVPLFVAGLGCIDAGVFTLSLAAGLIVTGVSFIGLEYALADE
jgi:hypothetical protein